MQYPLDERQIFVSITFACKQAKRHQSIDRYHCFPVYFRGENSKAIVNDQKRVHEMVNEIMNRFLAGLPDVQAA